jgi:hypothetical protein
MAEPGPRALVPSRLFKSKATRVRQAKYEALDGCPVEARWRNPQTGQEEVIKGVARFKGMGASPFFFTATYANGLEEDLTVKELTARRVEL